MKTEKFLHSLVNYEKVPGYNYDLEAYKKFLEKLDSPHKKLKNVILIAGTKGKGSTAAMINSCLIGNGYKVGLFTSPHLKKVNERITVNNRQITDKELKKYLRIIKPHINRTTRIGARTFFEVLTAVAFLHFVEKRVDFTILEVGLGGRLDATNVVSAPLPVIARIGYDHTDLLGNKLSQIAYEKAGIIPTANIAPGFRPRKLRNLKGVAATFENKRLSTRTCNDSVVITIHQRPSVEKVLKKVARERGCKLIFAESQHIIKEISPALLRQKKGEVELKPSQLHISGKLGNFKTSLPLVGRHQIENLHLVLSVLNELKNRGFKISLSAVKRGIQNTKLPGRFEIISKNPLIIYDVAHNEDSFRALEENLKEIYEHPPKRNLYLIFGCNKDKDINYAIKNIFPKTKEVLLVKANNPRAREPIEIYAKAKSYQKNIKIASSVKGGIDYLKTKIDDASAILIFGSFYLYPGDTLYCDHQALDTRGL